MRKGVQFDSIVSADTTSVYHVLNRGVDKRNIFQSTGDCYRFIHSLYEFNDEDNADNSLRHFNANTPVVYVEKVSNSVSSTSGLSRKQRKLLVRIHAFCLMKNHYHLILSPYVDNGIPRFMKKINIGYAKYFNEKNKRVGALFQGRYKRVLVTNEPQLIYLPFYLHLNPLDFQFPEWRNKEITSHQLSLEYLEKYKWSSHLDYMGIKNFPSVTHRDFFLNLYEGGPGYKKAISSYLQNLTHKKTPNYLTLE